MTAATEHDDFALSWVPRDRRYHWFSIAVQCFGMLSSLASFLIGATLGFGMSFWHAVLAITLGAVILEVLTIFTGIAGQREGLSTSVLARWTGLLTSLRTHDHEDVRLAALDMFTNREA